MPQRFLIYAGTLLTGMTGLIYQIVWQKYLTFVVGSDTRAVVLVVATFLAGLAAGYRYWGNLSERIRDRRRLLGIYGAIEIGIGAYAAVFPIYLQLVRYVSHHGPPWLVTDVLVSLLTILGPTFLMGATIPLLVSVVPERAQEVHLCHAKIYGINTLGACLGAFGSSLILIPRVGLPGALWLGAAVNVVVGTGFLLNRLEGSITQKEEIREIPNSFRPGSLYVYTLVTGMVTLSFEVLFVRLLDLTIGPGPHNFAMIVGVFIFGLALGSLLITDRLLSVNVLFGALTFLTGYLIVLYLSIPYWPYWMSNVRVLLADLPANYMVFNGLVSGFLLLVLLPFLVPLGFMLPLVYALLPKDTLDYGRQCGRLYFFNTLGTAIGAIVLAHLALNFLELDGVFKVNVVLLIGLAAWLMSKERRFKTALVGIVVALAFLAFPSWNRDSYYQGLYRQLERAPWHLTGVFRTPRVASEDIDFYHDGPDATVTVMAYDQPFIPEVPPRQIAHDAVSPVRSRALIINGKGDGDTVGDYSTITLAGLLPYLYAPDRSDLEAAVIGLGTGLTAATLRAGEDVDHVTVAEISSTLVEALPTFDEDNGGLSRRADVEILAIDGFKFFTRLRGELDVVVSASSAPWVTGVENLFTPEFYRLAHGALADDGVFLQWFPLYTMDATMFRTIVGNIRGVFPHLRLYRISRAEMGLLAGKRPLAAPVPRRLDEPELRRILGRMQLERMEQLELIELFGTAELDFLVEAGPVVVHDMSRPSLSYISDRIRFASEAVSWDQFVDRRVERLTSYSDERRRAFMRLIEAYPSGTPCESPFGECVFASRFEDLREAYLAVSRDDPGTDPRERLAGYDRLRQAGCWPADGDFLATLTTALTEVPPGTPAVQEVVDGIMFAYVKDGLWDEALSDLDRLTTARHVDGGYRARLAANINGSRQMYDDFVRRVRQSG